MSGLWNTVIPTFLVFENGEVQTDALPYFNYMTDLEAILHDDRLVERQV